MVTICYRLNIAPNCFQRVKSLEEKLQNLKKQVDELVDKSDLQDGPLSKDKKQQQQRTYLTKEAYVLERTDLVGQLESKSQNFACFFFICFIFGFFFISHRAAYVVKDDIEFVRAQFMDMTELLGKYENHNKVKIRDIENKLKDLNDKSRKKTEKSSQKFADKGQNSTKINNAATEKNFESLSWKQSELMGKYKALADANKRYNESLAKMEEKHKDIAQTYEKLRSEIQEQFTQLSAVFGRNHNATQAQLGTLESSMEIVNGLIKREYIWYFVIPGEDEVDVWVESPRFTLLGK